MSSIDGMEINDDIMTESKRKSRNKSEKKRRDAFNKLITELHTMVTNGERKLDKSNVLKQTIAYLKLHNQTNRTGADSQGPDLWKPSFLTNPEYYCLMMEGAGAFVCVICSTGTIMFASEGLSDLVDAKKALKGCAIFDYLDKASSAELQTFLSAEVLRAASAQNYGAEPNKSMRTLNLQVKRLLKGDSLEYIPVKLAGKFKRVAFSPEEMYELAGKGVAISPTAETSCFVCVGRPTGKFHSRNALSWPMNATEKMEFTATYNMECKFIGIDQRALGVLGYIPLEVLGNSGYDYCHPTDLNILVADHKLLMERGKTTSPPYRFLTKGNQWIWLQTSSYISYHQWNSKPEFIVATSWVLPDGSKRNGKEGMSEGPVSSTSTLSGLAKIKSEPLIRQSGECEKDRGNKSFFRPQPGVSIEHSPIPSSVSPATQSKKAGSSPGGIRAQEQEPSADSQQLCEQLQLRQTALQQQILMQQEELKQLQEQLLRSPHPVDPPQPVFSTTASLAQPVVVFDSPYSVPCVRAQSPTRPIENCHWGPTN